MQNPVHRITLFTTIGCHLCEDALAMLQYYQDQNISTFSIHLVEITDSEQLIELYGVRIPVLKHSGTGLELSWPFNPEQLALFLQNKL